MDIFYAGEFFAVIVGVVEIADEAVPCVEVFHVVGLVGAFGEADVSDSVFCYFDESVVEILAGSVCGFSVGDDYY